jgi:hypothetical protein
VIAADHCYRQGLHDGYFGHSPEQHFTDSTVERSEHEMAWWFAGHEDGAAIAQLDATMGSSVGRDAIVRLAVASGVVGVSASQSDGHVVTVRRDGALKRAHCSCGWIGPAHDVGKGCLRDGAAHVLETKQDTIGGCSSEGEEATTAPATERVYSVRYSLLGMGWWVMSASSSDRYDVVTESGPYTSREQAQAKLDELLGASV